MHFEAGNYACLTFNAGPSGLALRLAKAFPQSSRIYRDVQGGNERPKWHNVPVIYELLHCAVLDAIFEI